MMYYVERNNEGAIVALYANPQEGRTDPEPLSDTDPEVVAFLNPPEPESLDPVEKLAAFLRENPDVALLIGV